MEIFSTATGTVSAVESWGIEIIRLFQSIQSPALTNFIIYFTDSFGLLIYIFLLPVLYWVYNEKTGIKLFLAVFLTVAVNTGLKMLLAVPRPYQVDQTVYIIAELGYSTPSGHSQITATFWVLFALLLPANGTKRRGVLRICTATIIPFLVGLSRIYLGVHYPTDVVFGWILGGVLAFILYNLFSILNRFFSSQRKQIKTLAFAIVAASFIATIGAFQTGLIFGFGMGYILILEKGGYNAQLGSINQKLVRLVIGFTAIAVVSFGVIFIVSALQDLLISLGLFDILIFASTTLIGFFVTYIAPRFFVRKNIALSYENPFSNSSVAKTTSKKTTNSKPSSED